MVRSTGAPPIAGDIESLRRPADERRAVPDRRRALASWWSGRLHAFIADHVHDVELFIVRDQRAALEASPHVLLIDDVDAVVDTDVRGRRPRATTFAWSACTTADGGVGRARLAALGLTHLLEEAMPPEDVVFLLDRLRPTGSVDRGDSSAAMARRRRMPSGAQWLRSADHPDPAHESSLSVWRQHLAGAGRSDLAHRRSTRRLRASPAGSGSACTRTCSRRRPDPRRTAGGARSLARRRAAAAAVRRDRRHADARGTGIASLPQRCRGRCSTRCRDGWERVVVTTSPLIEDLQRWGDRFGISRRVLAIADVSRRVRASPRLAAFCAISTGSPMPHVLASDVGDGPEQGPEVEAGHR